MANKVDNDTFNYQLLGRLQSDCEYFLNAGNGSEKQLWAGNVKDQIAKMKELWNGFKEKPEWLSMKEIEDYEKRMKAKLNESIDTRKTKLPTIGELQKMNEAKDDHMNLVDEIMGKSKNPKFEDVLKSHGISVKDNSNLKGNLINLTTKELEEISGKLK